MSVKVLAGASVRIDPTTFAAHLKTLKAQRLPKHVELDFYHIVDDDNPSELIELIREQGGEWEYAEARPKEARYGVGAQTHAWNVATFDHLAQSKQRIFEYAQKHRYDYVWIADTDLLCSPDTLASMLSVQAPIISSVFWTSWQKGSVPGPNTWLNHPYGLEGMGMSQPEYFDKLARRRVVPVRGGGACCLFNVQAMWNGASEEWKARYYPRLEGLPSTGMWQGEDRTMAIMAEQNHIQQFADGWPDIFHAYHPQDREADTLENVLEVLLAPQQTSVAYGDLVNFTVESLDDPQMQGKTFPVRGRLGGLALVPELEQALLDMPVGEERILEVKFPQMWPVPQLRGQSRIMRVEFVGAKPFSYAPVLSEHMFRGLE